MGIPHFEDLSIDQALEVLDFNWAVGEKLDGTYIKLGLDDDWRPYVSRHGDQKYYDLEDWPKECWTDSYRPAHITAFNLLESLKEHNAISAGQGFGAEIIACRQPNAIEYGQAPGVDGTLWITTVDFEPSHVAYEVLSTFRTKFTYLHPRSDYGNDTIWEDHSVQWAVILNSPLPKDQVQKMQSFGESVKTAALFFLETDSAVPGMTMRNVLEANLNKTPREYKDLVKTEREKARGQWKNLMLIFKTHVGETLAKIASQYKSWSTMTEGFVIQCPEFSCKITDRENFTKLNTFVHRIKYMMVGGRRPARPSFLSRTKDWPLECRLARLNILRLRYLKHYDELFYHYTLFGKSGTMFYNGDLHFRMLNLFADIKTRLEDGR